jgi:hypothetical protein
MVKRTKKTVKCPIVKPHQAKISAKNMQIHKKYLDCMNTKCKEFVDKDIKITETCIDKTSHINFFKNQRMLIRSNCYQKNGLLDNVLNKLNCMNTKCMKETKKYQKIPDNQQTLDDTTASKLSFFHKEQKRLQEKELKIYPIMKKLTKIHYNKALIRNTMSQCKDESEKKKLQNKIDRLDKIYKKIEADNHKKSIFF